MPAHNTPPKRTIVKERIWSAHLARERSLRILLPPNYNASAGYPVIYCQDGEQFFNYGRIATIAIDQVTNHGMPPCIIVGIDVELKRRTEEYSPDGQFFSDYCAFVGDELVPYIEGHYAAIRSSDARILAGASLGAAVSLHLAMQYRDLFRRVLSFSGAYWADTHEQIRLQGDWSELDMYMLIGLEETAVDTERGTFDFVSGNRMALAQLEKSGANILYREREGTHLWGFWQKNTIEALRHFLP